MRTRPIEAIPPELRHQLLATREALLSLHKALLDEERIRYERLRGPIESSYHFLQLVIGDPWFAWLHPLSQLVVAIDEFVASRDPVTAEAARDLLAAARSLLRAEEQAEGFAGEYHRALQASAGVGRLHAEAMKAAG